MSERLAAVRAHEKRTQARWAQRSNVANYGGLASGPATESKKSLRVRRVRVVRRQTSCTLSDMSTQDRVPVTVRMAQAGVREIDRMAADEDRDRSSMIRILVKEAVEARRKKAGQK